MDLDRRTARALVAHLPEVVLHVSRHDPVVRKAHCPGQIARLIVRAQVKRLATLEIGGVQAVRVKLEDIGEHLPGPVEGLLLEIVAKGPIAEHLEERVVIAVLADVITVVVLSSGADTLLRVGGALQLAEFGAHVDGAIEIGLVLAHTGVDKEEGGIVVRYDRGRRHKIMTFVEVEIEEGLANFVRRPDIGSRCRNDNEISLSPKISPGRPL